MSAIKGTVAFLLISFIARALFSSGIASLTIRAPAFTRSFISLISARISFTPVLAIAWTTMGFVPPILTSPTLTTVVFRLLFLEETEYVIVGYEHHKGNENSYPNLLGYLLFSLTHRPATYPFYKQKQNMAAIQDRDR